jgi:hypothetical protein
MRKVGNQSIAPDWEAVPPQTPNTDGFDGLIRPCREPLRGWLKTIRSVK